MKRVIESGTSKKGVASLRKTAEYIIVKLDGHTYEIPYEDAPKILPEGEEVFVRIWDSNTGPVLNEARPAGGSHVVRFKQFGRDLQGETDIPMPWVMKGGPRKTKTGKTWVAPDKLVFTAELEILVEPHKGILIPLLLDYLFEQYEDTGHTMIRGSGKAAQRVVKFMELAGFDWNTDDVEWSENVLPALEALLSTKDKIFMVTMTGTGYPDSLSELPAGVTLGA